MTKLDLSFSTINCSILYLISFLAYFVAPSAVNDELVEGLILNGGDNNDELIGDVGNDQINGSDGNDELLGLAGDDQINGGSGDDELSGFEGNDQLFGGKGNDELSGFEGNDQLFGGDGNDILIGGDGVDILTGGNGRDRFTFYALNDSLLSNFDVIKDLNIGKDKIDGLSAVNNTSISGLGIISILTELNIQSLLDTTSFSADQVATFRVSTSAGERTFLAFNDSINGFSALTDAVIEITGYKGNLSELAIV